MGLFRLVKKDNSIKWIRVEGQIIYNDQGERVSLFGTAADVSSEVEKEEALKLAQMKSEESSRLKSQFLANMSHEIRTPMNAVIGMTDLLLDTHLDSNQRDLTEMVNDSAKGLLTIVNDILDYSKVEAGMLSLESEPFDLRCLMHRIKSMFKVKLAEKNIQFDLLIDVNVPTALIGDRNRLQQIIVNLVGNAIKFTPEQGAMSVKASFEYRAEAREGILNVSVLDTGIGISPNCLSDIFSVFTQADPSITRKYGGTGLGLSISAQLVKLMGGSIDVRSTLGSGSDFSFSVQLGACSTTHNDSEADQIHSPKPIKNSLSVLVVEDNLLNQKLAVKLLEKQGYLVEVVENGQMALESLSRNSKFDIILMDIHMPVMGGEEATRRIRQMSSCSQIPIIALTANAMIGEKERLLSQGFSGYVTKPIDRVVLLKEMSSLVSRTFQEQGNL